MFGISLVIVSLVAFAAGKLDPQIHAMYKLLPRDKFIEYFNNLGLSYNITHYDNEPFVCGLVKNSKRQYNLTLIEHTATDDLPTNFDSRVNWPQCVTIKEIYNQLQCGSCWVFGAATTASDRTCIHKDITVRLSEQDFDCYDKDVCAGGTPESAFWVWTQYGLVSQECKPYNVPNLRKGVCETKCVNGKDYKADKHIGSSQSDVKGDDNTIKMELFQNGPIQASMNVYEDFFHYKEGIYVHKFGNAQGGHSVRVIGYGEENGVKFWLAANSWGKSWGMKGFFKIKRRQKDIEFESNMISCLP